MSRKLILIVVLIISAFAVAFALQPPAEKDAGAPDPSAGATPRRRAVNAPRVNVNANTRSANFGGGSYDGQGMRQANTANTGASAANTYSPVPGKKPKHFGGGSDDGQSIRQTNPNANNSNGAGNTNTPAGNTKKPKKKH